MKKKPVYVGVFILVALIFALPATRDELDWLWALSRDQATDYMQYYTDWPNGLHTTEARRCYKARLWSETKRAMINEALKTHSSKRSSPEARKEQRARRDRFFWQEATREDTLESYQDYLTNFPSGQFADEARRRLDELGRKGTGGNAGNP
jgi:hypothetical protein